MPSWVEWSMMAGLSAGFVLALIFFSKFFPIISIWEMEKEEKEKEEKVGWQTHGARNTFEQGKPPFPEI